MIKKLIIYSLFISLFISQIITGDSESSESSTCDSFISPFDPESPLLRFVLVNTKACDCNVPTKWIRDNCDPATARVVKSYQLFDVTAYAIIADRRCFGFISNQPGVIAVSNNTVFNTTVMETPDEETNTTVSLSDKRFEWDLSKIVKKSSKAVSDTMKPKCRGCREESRCPWESDSCNEHSDSGHSSSSSSSYSSHSSSSSGSSGSSSKSSESCTSICCKDIEAEGCNCQVSLLWNLNRLSNEDPESESLLYLYPNGSLPVKVYILNTGINVRHCDLRGRAFRGPNFVRTEPINTDLNGSGTAVASVVGSTTGGVSKTARMESVKVLNATGYGWLDYILSGIEYAIQDYTKKCECNVAAVMDLSFYGPLTTVLNGAVDAAVRAGIHVSTHAGYITDEVEDACQYSPASAAQAFTAADSNILNIYSPIENQGSCVKIVAPADGIFVLGAASNATLFPIASSQTGLGGAVVSGVTAAILALCSYHHYSPSALRTVIRTIAIPGVVDGITLAGTPNLLINFNQILKSLGCLLADEIIPVPPNPIPVGAVAA